jgi:diphthamide synthase (EF-2-diphthine--ammonia ligase)
MTGVFPIWQRDTRELVETFTRLGFRAVLCCVEGAKLDASFVGRSLDLDLLADLPPGIDPCGENGEYHSFVYEGPIFQWPVAFETGITVCRDNRHYIDLVLPDSSLRPMTASAAIPPV